MRILGLAAPFGHDSSAALLVNGRLVAAAEEERFTRKKHAEGQLPVHAIQYCLKQANCSPAEIDIVAFPWSIKPLRERRWEYFMKTFRTRPSPAFKKLTRNAKELRGRKEFVYSSLRQCGFNPEKVDVRWVEHQMAHVASSCYFSGMREASVLSIDAGGEITSTLLGELRDGKITKTKEIVSSDSLGNFYATMTDYLGFKRGNGEYKVMGMAPFGNAAKVDFDHIIHWDERRKTYHCNDDYIWATRDRRVRVDKVYSKKMVAEFGPERKGDGLSEPYIDIAAATQKKLEDVTVHLVESYLRPALEKHGNLCFAGGCALNVALNRILLTLPYIKNLWVQPAAHDSGTSLGAAVTIAQELGEPIQPMRHAYYGPEYANEEIEAELKEWAFTYTKEKDIALKAATLLDQGEIVAWFQGRMEWGPRSLGARSILGNPTVRGTADKINEIIKFREKWRPFCPSVLKEHAAKILDSDHHASFMTIAFKMNQEWAKKLPEVVHVDGTCRPQVVEKETNPLYHRLIENFYKKTGMPVVINTSLNRRGEPVVCNPHDAMLMFEGSGLDFMAIGDFLVSKKEHGYRD